ncbi:MAG: hypothetical protein A2Z37_11520 [Chloroflexi bacterium RBG_19FT_COMBO_62_14]|jgi:hypothetical protein|nr:MAG: hypothetical protein A2Z37_11520 [Chloroflexi bacterium RBG_19FT_COMBO_62_14]
MPDSSLGMKPQDASERQRFEREVKRIVTAADAAGLTLRILGSLAFQTHCPDFGYLQAEMGRAYTDIDFAGYGRQASEIRRVLAELGYVEDREVFVVTEGGRAIFENHSNQLHVDVFYEKLDFCHVIPWNGRLEVDSPTIPLAELMLEKMQIVLINEKDVIDTIMLLLEHSLGDTDHEIINTSRIAELCGQDWGLWRTVTMNLDKVRLLSQGYPQLSDEQKASVVGRLAGITERIEDEPKNLAWRLRARVGDRVKWYKDVEEVQ